jgi:hypothetical protein
MNHTDRSSAQIQADIQRTRVDLDRTLTLLERRLEPRRLVDQSFDYLRNNGAREYLSNLGQAAKEQPLPLALVGVGLAWMMMTNGRAHGRSDVGHNLGASLADAGSRVEDSVDALRNRANDLGGKVSGAASQLASQTRDAAQRTSQTLSEAADATRARAAQVSEATRQGAQKVRASYEHLVNEEPLALGAIGLALGAVLAAAAPRTRQEDEWMGRSSDQLMEDAKRTGKEKLEDVKGALAEASEGGDEREEHRAKGRATGAASANEERPAESDRLSQVRSPQYTYDTTAAQEQASPMAYDPDAAGQHSEDAYSRQTTALNPQREPDLATATRGTGVPMG